MEQDDKKAKEEAYEQLRQQALDSYEILDTPFEQEFDDIVNLAAYICQTPIALISLVDRERQWFKASHGLEPRQTDRSVSFCAHAMKGTELFIVPDATVDPRFKDNALVTGQPNVVFYAGAPIINEDQFGLGSLCVIDSVPRELSPPQLEALRALGRQVSKILLSRKQTIRLRSISEQIEQHLVLSKNEFESKYNAAKKAADQAELEFRGIFDSFAIGVVQIHPQSAKILRCNKTYADMVGFSENELRTMTVHDLTHEEDRARTVEVVDRLSDSRDPVMHNEKRYVRKDGTSVWVRITAVMVRNADGSPLQITGVLNDITSERSALKEKSEALEEMSLHKETLALATHAGKIGVWEWEFANDDLKLNDILRDIYELPSNRCKGDDTVSRILPEDMEQTRKVIAAAEALRQPYKTEFRIRRKNGELRTLVSAGSTIFGKDGQRQRMVGVNLDVTDTRAAEAERAQLEIQARSATESSRLKSEFLANMSHEIRTPINGIIGMTSLLKDTVQSAEQKRFTSSIATASQILLTLINDILDLSKVESGKLDLEVVPFNARKLSADLSQSFDDLFKAKGVELEIDYAAKEDIFVGDPSRLLQILNNLVGNALKFTSKGKVRVEIRDQLSFRVTDSGIGMSKHVCQSLFQKFSQGDASTARKFGGTGLGLAICKHLCALMGGDIEVESVEGQGSTFSFTIPLRVPDTQEVESMKIESVTQPSSFGKAERSQFRILVAEDNFINQEITLRGLQKAGYRAEAVVNGVQVLTAMVSGTYDLILMDCQMPEMDGFEATRQLRKKGFQLPIVALTANAYQEDKDRCLESGMNDYLSKPVRDDVLLAMVDRFLGATGGAKPAVATLAPSPIPAPAPTAPPVAAGSILNLNQLRDLQVLDPDGKDGFVQGLIKVWVESAPRIAGEMKSATPAQMGKLAHSLKSTSANLGAMKVAAILKALEFGKVDASEQPAQLAALTREIELAITELNRYVSALEQKRSA